MKALGGKADAIAVDMAEESGARAAVDAAVEKFGRLDILVNNAGINIRKPPQDYSLEEWHRVLNINLTSLFVCCQAAYPHLKARGGKIINIGSMMSIFGASFAAPYGASKGGVVQLTKSLASAWAGDNIQVNAVLPGWIDTELTKGAREQVSGLHEKVLARTPAGRWGAPEDMAGIAVFLASAGVGFHHRHGDPGGWRLQRTGLVSPRGLCEPAPHRPPPSPASARCAPRSKDGWRTGRRCRHAAD